MSGGQAQLVAIGSQDAHLVGNPEVSFFQSTYKRYTNFSQVIDRQLIQGNPCANGMSTVRFERKGDLLSYVYIAPQSGSTTVPDWTHQISYIELYIGGSLIDTQTSDFCEKLAPSLMASTYSKSVSSGIHGGGGSKFYPLRFFFCENVQSSLPVVAIQNQDVEIRIFWAAGFSGQYDVFANFIYLDTTERESLVKRPINMLITQNQKIQGIGGYTQDLPFNHPIKYIASADGDGLTTGSRIRIQINGLDISDSKPAVHFNQIQKYYNVPFADNTDDYFLYSFGLDTAKPQPSGTLNFSRLDSARIVVEGGSITNMIYAVNYNVLKIQNGLCGLLYSN